MKSSLKEELARLGPVKAVDRVSGSPQRVTIRALKAKSPEGIKAVEAVLQIARRGLALADARHIVEEIVAGKVVEVDVPCFDDLATFLSDLFVTGVLLEKNTALLPADIAAGVSRAPGLAQSQLTKLIQVLLDSGVPIEDVRNTLAHLTEIVSTDTSETLARKKA